MKIVYSDRYHLDLGAHVFPTVKYPRVRHRLLDGGVAQPDDFLEPSPATWEDLGLVHAPDYLEKLQQGRLSREEIAQMEIPWSMAIVEGFRLMVGGTLVAARLVLDGDGVAQDVEAVANERDASREAPAARARRPWSVVLHSGEGFCMFNDVAVAIRCLKRDGQVARAAIVDCDVHHGNGTASIFAGDRSVFTFSMHQLHNYPAVKPPGSLDIALDDQTTDEEYLAELRHALPRVFASRAQIVFYLAGADPYADDQLGGLRLTKEGLRRRDRLVFEAARDAGVPVVVTLAGGYARQIDDTVDIHVATIEEARAALDSSPDGESAGES